MYINRHFLQVKTGHFRAMSLYQSMSEPTVDADIYVRNMPRVSVLLLHTHTAAPQGQAPSSGYTLLNILMSLDPSDLNWNACGVMTQTTSVTLSLGLHLVYFILR